MVRTILFSSSISGDLGLQATRGVGEHHVDARLLGLLDGVEDDRPGIGAFLALDDLAPHALAPDFELLDGGRAEGVARGQHHRLSLGSSAWWQACRCVVVLPTPLTPDHEHHRGLGRELNAARRR